MTIKSLADPDAEHAVIAVLSVVLPAGSFPEPARTDLRVYAPRFRKARHASKRGHGSVSLPLSRPSQ
jgi:hypothetical protein